MDLMVQEDSIFEIAPSGTALQARKNIPFYVAWFNGWSIIYKIRPLLRNVARRSCGWFPVTVSASRSSANALEGKPPDPRLRRGALYGFIGCNHLLVMEFRREACCRAKFHNIYYS